MLHWHFDCRQLKKNASVHLIAEKYISLEIRFFYSNLAIYLFNYLSAWSCLQVCQSITIARVSSSQYFSRAALKDATS